jgi:hypothetical protein
MMILSTVLLSVAGCHSSSGPGGTSGGLADLIPGHQEAELRKRVDADKDFPSADQALNPSFGGDGNRARTSN